jgi:glucan phosphoethanolaminetransferase (alkaline phosphatase superfamily)
MGTQLARYKRLLLGDRPRSLAPFAAPTVLAVVLDLTLRARTIAAFALVSKLVWVSSLLVSASFWALPLWIASRARALHGGAGRVAALAIGLFPLATFAYAGQTIYFRVFHAYIGRDTVRLGVGLRGTVRDWLFAWQSPTLLVGMALAGAIATIGILIFVRRATPPATGSAPALLVVTFALAGVCFWFDFVDSRFLQAATPDVCFVHGVTRAVRMALSGKARLHQGMSLRTPAPLPTLTSTRAHPPNVVLLLTESVRADAMCSVPHGQCSSPFLDEVAPDRIGLGRLTTQTPSTFSACLLLLTGLEPNVDFATAHSAPVLWELARAVGYRTAYVSAQNMNYEGFGAFVRHAGIDVLVTPAELGGVADVHIGAPDERALAEALRFVRGAPRATPYFALVHLSNTHTPYRVDPELQPFVPHSDDPFDGVLRYHNHYKNSVYMQERAISSFLRDLRALPNFRETVVLVLSDHGEQFLEHGSLYHNRTLYDEELRVPGWLVAGEYGLGEDERAALASYGASRTFMQDVFATVVDLFGLREARASLPFAARVGGRSLLLPRVAGEEPFALLANSTAVWEADMPIFGGMLGDVKVTGTKDGDFTCVDTKRHPSEATPLTGSECDALIARVKRAYWR